MQTLDPCPTEVKETCAKRIAGFGAILTFKITLKPHGNLSLKQPSSAPRCLSTYLLCFMSLTSFVSCDPRDHKCLLARSEHERRMMLPAVAQHCCFRTLGFGSCTCACFCMKTTFTTVVCHGLKSLMLTIIIVVVIVVTHDTEVENGRRRLKQGQV